jgi:hypothetical protein
MRGQVTSSEQVSVSLVCRLCVVNLDETRVGMQQLLGRGGQLLGYVSSCVSRLRLFLSLCDTVDPHNVMSVVY